MEPLETDQKLSQGGVASEESEPGGGESEPGRLGEAILGVAYIPDFLAEDLRFWFVPTRESPTAVYHELVGEAAETWGTYYTKKGAGFLNKGREGEGPFRVDPEDLHFEIQDPGKLFAPKPIFRFTRDGSAIPLVSLEKRRPINEWKPNYIKALNFIKKYEWTEPVPRAVHYAVWEIEECGEVAGSTAWRNAERILRDARSPAVLKTLSDIFFNRPEDFPLGSEVYLRILGDAGEAGFAELVQLAKHPIARKRKVVAQAFGALATRGGLPSLLMLLDDEDPEVRTAALRSTGNVGVNDETDPERKVASYLESDEISKRVWAAQALFKGGDTSHQKFFMTLVKEEPRLLSDMGELGDVLGDIQLLQVVPFVINRLKHDKPEYRADAADALEKLTGLELNYTSHDQSPEVRRQAIRLCNRWWSDYKRTRAGKK